MWRVGFPCFLVTFCCAQLASQISPPEPQSARQALIEMFMGKKADDLLKHLPADARRTLLRKGEGPDTSIALRIAGAVRELGAQGQVESFDVGPNILVRDSPSSHERLEIRVESDSLVGEDDQIELSVHNFKDGQEEALPIVPRIIFTMRESHDVWQLAEITVAAHIPLTDPEYLKHLRQEQDESNENMARTRMGMIAQAEKVYASAHAERGFTCELAELYPSQPQSDDSPTQVPGVADEEFSGYRLALAGCNGTPASKYRLTATPIDEDSEMKSYCSDESGTLKSIAASKSKSCFSRGEAVTTNTTFAPAD